MRYGVMLKNQYKYVLYYLKRKHIGVETIRRGIILFVFCIMTVGLWANPFTGKKDTPAPIRTEKTADFIVNRQAQLHTKLGDSIYEWTQTNSAQAFWTIIALAFFYGIVHALGPGHRKTLVFSFYLTRQAPAWEPAVTSLILAGLHGIMSILLLLIFRNVSGALSAHTDSAAIYLEGFSFILLMLLSVASILHLLSGIFPNRFPRFRFSRRSLAPGQSSKPAYNTGSYGSARYKNHRPQYSSAGNIQWGAFLLSGIYPCPAALLVLVLVSTLDAAGIGIIAVIGMSIGMAIPITVAAYLAWTGRQRLFKRIGKTQKYAETAALVLSLAAYSAIFIFSLTAVLPFIKSVIG
ncbi:hypothetical protein HMPREF9195_01281 [Treponema medium ATCC 700293]|uniref:Nickel/cobalt efflux system n=2 Tax=Treponema medium TaxID=58231 RepID=A0AA87NML7_TREMD|nr:hypothetical protein HMPREF9195_01281 [Treponema medium ATCC 700293]